VTFDPAAYAEKWFADHPEALKGFDRVEKMRKNMPLKPEIPEPLYRPEPEQVQIVMIDEETFEGKLYPGYLQARMDLPETVAQIMREKQRNLASFGFKDDEQS
jgi:hypothetical protein